jgi:large subunit ribosomal protein L21
MAAAITAVGVVTGRRRRRRARRQDARDRRRQKRAQRKGQGGRGGAARRAAASAGVTGASGPSPAAASSAAAGMDSGSTDEPEQAAVPEAAEITAGDDLRAIKGLGAMAASKLQEAGITTYAQIAAWSEADIHEIATRLGLQAGRITADDWVRQARRLLEERTSA